MSVHFNVRRVDEKTLIALRRDPALMEALCDCMLDFDPVDYERQWMDRTPPERRAASRPSFDRRLETMVTDKLEALTSLRKSGIEWVEPLLELQRSWWGMKAMIHAPAGERLIDGHEGEALGGDVGYGPAHLLSPADLDAILVDLDVVIREDAERRFRAHEKKEQATPGRVCSDEQFDEWSWRPFCTLREYVRTTAARRAWLVRWYQ